MSTLVVKRIKDPILSKIKFFILNFITITQIEIGTWSRGAGKKSKGVKKYQLLEET